MINQDDLSQNKINTQNSSGSKIGKIVIDKDICIGAGPCAVLADKTFTIVNGKAELVDPNILDNPQNTDQEIIDAAMSCPVYAIKIYDKSGKLIYPQN